MNKARLRAWPYMVTTLVVAQLMCVPVNAQVSKEVLDSISTPNQVETSIGTLEFFDGIPTEETAKLLYDNLDFLRGVETLLNMLKDEVFAATGSWFTGVGDPVVLLNESLAGLVDVCYRLGPILRATDDASANDETLEKAWMLFVGEFDDAITSRIEADQAQDLITNFDARPIAIALNRLNIYTLTQDFGQQSRSKSETVHKALARVWISTLYRAEWLEKGSSNISRT